MSALSSLDTSQHTTPLSALQLNGNQLLSSAKVAETNAKLETPNIAAEDKETPKVDLNNYYSNVQSPSLNSDVESQAVQAEQNLSNAIATAVTHGMNPQDAVNIQKAKAAYESTMKATQTTTNFELSVE